MTERRDRAHRWVGVGIWCLVGMSFVVSAALVGFVALMIAARMSSPGLFGPEVPAGVLIVGGVAAIGSGTAVAVWVAHTSRRRPLDQLTQRAIAGYVLLFSAVLVAAFTVGPTIGEKFEGLSPEEERLLAQVPAGLQLDCENAPSFTSTFGVGTVSVTCLGKSETQAVAWVDLLQFEDPEELDDFYAAQLAQARSDGDFLKGYVPEFPEFQADPKGGRKHFDPTQGMQRDSTTQSFFADCRRYGASEESYVSGDRAGRVLCMEYRWGGGSHPTVIWTDERALVAFLVFGGPDRAVHRWWYDEWLGGEGFQILHAP